MVMGVNFMKTMTLWEAHDGEVMDGRRIERKVLQMITAAIVLALV